MRNLSTQTIYHILALMAASIICGCRQEDQLLPVSMPRTSFNISGTVYVHDRGTAGVAVTCGTRETVTDSSGGYVFR